MYVKMIDKSTGIPKYIQLKEILKERLKNGTFHQGGRFSTNRELMSQYHISYATVTHTMRQLVNEGYLYRKVGGGTFVKNFVPQEYDREETVSSPPPPLYINGTVAERQKLNSSTSWFVHNEIQRGIINSYGGTVDRYL